MAGTIPARRALGAMSSAPHSHPRVAVVEYTATHRQPQAVDGGGRTQRETFGNGVAMERGHDAECGTLRKIVTARADGTRVQDSGTGRQRRDTDVRARSADGQRGGAEVQPRGASLASAVLQSRLAVRTASPAVMASRPAVMGHGPWCGGPVRPCWWEAPPCCGPGPRCGQAARR